MLNTPLIKLWLGTTYIHPMTYEYIITEIVADDEE
jgi:hypothetical protein